MPSHPRFLFLLASTRRNGNSEGLARLASGGLPPGAEARWLRLDEHPLPPFEDTRHGAGYGDLEGESRFLAEATLEATDLVVVTPVYWYGLPAGAKLYFDHWSGWMRAPSLGFQEAMAGKGLWAVVADSDTEGEGGAVPLLEALTRTADYLGMAWRGALVGHGSRPGEAWADPETRTAAEAFFREGPHVPGRT